MGNILHLVDLDAARFGREVPRFTARVEVDPPNPGHDPGWRQMKPTSAAIKIAAGNYEILDSGVVLFKSSNQHRNRAWHAFSLDRCVNGSTSDFPRPGTYGVGRIFETPTMDNSNTTSQILWIVDPNSCVPPDPRFLWVGAVLKCGGHLVGYRRESAVGFIVNAADMTNVWDITFDSTGWGPGLGASTGLCLVVVTAHNPKEIVGSTSSQWDFNLSFAGKVDGYIKTIGNVGRASQSSWKIMKYIKPAFDGLIGSKMEVGRAGIALHNNLKTLHGSGALENFVNAAKIACNGMNVDWASPGFSVIDLPAPMPGLELGIVSTTATVIDTVPWTQQR